MISNMYSTMVNTFGSVQHAMKNPFGLDFEVYNNKVYIPLGSALNCLGYNDHLERMIGVARLASGLFALVMSTDIKMRLTAGAHIFRAALEMVGNFERELLVIDVVVTIYNIGRRFFSSQADPLNAALANPDSEDLVQSVG